MATNVYIENWEPAVRQAGGLKTKKPVTLSGTSATLAVGGTSTFTGAATFTVAPTFSAGFGATTITSTSANSLAVGPNGTTNPVFKVDSSTASAATGLSVTGAAAAGGLALAVISSGTNENLTVDAKGSGTLTLNGTATGNIVLGRAATGVSLSVTGAVKAGSGTAITAGGSLSGLTVSSATNFGVFVGSGAPTISAAQGSLYLRSDGSTTSTRAYINSDGATTWVAVTTAS